MSEQRCAVMLIMIICLRHPLIVICGSKEALGVSNGNGCIMVFTAEDAEEELRELLTCHRSDAIPANQLLHV